MNQHTQLSKSGVRYRRAMGIPLDAPVIGNGRGGNYQISERKAKAIWADIKRLENAYPAKTVSICQLVADEHGVSKTLVQNIRHGRSWNSVTGLPRKIYDLGA
jgi:hypothetical protein